MKKTLLPAIAVSLLAIACKSTDNQNTNDMNTQESFQEVAGRKNFGLVGGAWNAGKKFTE